MEQRRRGVRHLLKTGKRGIMRVIFSRTGIILLFLALGVGLLFLLTVNIARWMSETLVGATIVFQLVTVAILINSRMDASAKITWLLLIAVVPVIGGTFYYFTKGNWGNRNFSRRVNRKIEMNRSAIRQDPDVMMRLAEREPQEAAVARYIASTGCYPVYQDTSVRYFAVGEDYWQSMLTDLENAQSYIYLEYFIIQEGEMWGEILDILARKVKDGIKVRVLYDGTCELTRLPHDYSKRLSEIGIECHMFSPLTPFVSTHYNYRDHRKNLVIDGKIAYTGGVNLADEYVNIEHPFGHWKDSGIRVQGPAVESFLLMFSEMWEVSDPSAALSTTEILNTAEPQEAEGFVLPFGDSPFDSEKVGEQVYMDFLNRAERYVHIMSPYLILDGELQNAICFAAQRGVDVRLILPGIPDKKFAYLLAKTYFPVLVESGVKIYTYTPGFLHSKSFVADGRRAFVGSINLDYRSLYHHFECGALLYDVPCIAEIEEDFQKTILECEPVTQERLKQEKLLSRVAGGVLKAIAPLL